MSRNWEFSARVVREFMASHLLLFFLHMYVCVCVFMASHLLFFLHMCVYVNFFLHIYIWIFGGKARTCPYSPFPTSPPVHWALPSPSLAMGRVLQGCRVRSVSWHLLTWEPLKRVVWPMSEQPCSWGQVTAFAQSHMNRSYDQLIDYYIISNRGAQMEWVRPSCSTCWVFCLLLTRVQA